MLIHLVFSFQLTTIFAVVEDTCSTAAPGEERQRWRHQPVDYTALPWTQCKATGCRQEKKTDQCMFFY